jgi:hypothetical protein
MKTHQKFLEFNGKNIIFLNVDGSYWIALKPICEALNIEYTRSFKNAKNDPILGPALAIQPMQVSKNGKSQIRNVTCIPEEFIYGWIFSINSESQELIEYKRTCYRLLYNHFHGVITNRKELLLERNQVDTEIHYLKEELKENQETYKKLKKLELKRKNISKKLNTQDKEFVKEPGFWDN